MYNVKPTLSPMLILVFPSYKLKILNGTKSVLNWHLKGLVLQVFFSHVLESNDKVLLTKFKWWKFPTKIDCLASEVCPTLASGVRIIPSDTVARNRSNEVWGTTQSGFYSDYHPHCIYWPVKAFSSVIALNVSAPQPLPCLFIISPYSDLWHAVTGVGGARRRRTVKTLRWTFWTVSLQIWTWNCFGQSL